MNIPYNYQQNNNYLSFARPGGVAVCDSGLFRFFRRGLLFKVMSVLKWELPAPWDWDYFVSTLVEQGFEAVIYVPAFGVIPQRCSLTGLNLYQRPSHVLVVNPLFPETVYRKIGYDAVVFKMSPDYHGFLDRVDYYAAQMAITAQGYSCNVLNTKLAYIFAADRNSAAESFKKLTDKILSGEPAVVVDKRLIDKKTGDVRIQQFENHIKENFVAPDLLDCLNHLSNDFATEVGITNSNHEKKERLLVDEVNANNQETETVMDMILDGFKRSCKEVRKIFGVEMSVDWRFREEVESDAESISQRNSNVSNGA